MLDNRSRGRVWLAHRGPALVGCSAIALRGADRAQLRWVLVDPGERGTGLGRRLVETALAFSREAGAREVYLETTDGLEASSRLYRSLGFEIVAESVTELWDGERPLIEMRLSL